jgi:phage baseplate assembly protein W
MNVAFPYHCDGQGRTATAEDQAHIRDMIEQVLFTSPGERVNRPDFGSGLLQLVFAPNSQELATTLQFTLRAALQQWLGDLIQVEDLSVENEDSTLHVMVSYANRRTQQREVATFSRSGVR